MRKFLSNRSIQLLALAATALVGQGDTPVSTCAPGLTLGYNTTNASPQDTADGMALPGSATPRCSQSTPDGVKIYSGTGAPGDKVYVVAKEGYTTDAAAANAAASLTTPPAGNTADAGVSSDGKSPAASNMGDQAIIGAMSAAGGGMFGSANGTILGIGLKENLSQLREQATHEQMHASAAAAAENTAPSSGAGQEEPACLGVVLPPGSPLTPPPVTPPIQPGTPPSDPGNRAPASAPPTTQGAGAAVGTVSGGAGIGTTSPIIPDGSQINPPIQNAGGPDSPHTGGLISSVYDYSVISDETRGQEIADMATASRQNLMRDAAGDQGTLAAPYRDLSPDAMKDYLQRAQASLGDAADVLDNSTGSGLDSSERARFHNYFLNARDKAQLGLDALALLHGDEAATTALGADSPFTGLLAAKDANPLAKNEALAGIFGAQMAAATATSPDALVNRMVMLNGLPASQRAQALGKLKLVEPTNFTRPDGTQVSLNLLHNGYLLGKTDCSSFVSSWLPADVRKGRFTTLDFRTMWIYDKTLNFPNPPHYTPERGKLVRDTATAFIPIDLYAGQHLRVGDLLVYRFLSDPIGHVVIVRSYNPATLRAEIIEAAQSAGTVRERTLNLSPDPMDAKRRLLMPGLFALRIKPVTNHACVYRDHAPGAGSAQPGGSGGGQ